MMFDMRLPEPSVGFQWVQAEGGTALVCSALLPLAEHLFTTRMWRLGSRSTDPTDDAWADVAQTLGVDPASLGRVHQVHGTAVVVARPRTSGLSTLNEDQIAGAAPGWQGATTENTGSI